MPNRYLTSVFVVYSLAACVKPTTQLAPVSPIAVQAEEKRQREIVVLELEKAQNRLDDMAFELLAAASRFCQDDVVPRIGVRLKTAHAYQGEYHQAARSVLGLGDFLTVTNVHSGSPAERGGIQEGDLLVQVEGSPVPRGADAARMASEAIRAAALSGSVNLTVRRAGIERQVSVNPERVCSYAAEVTVEGGINAFADGERIVFSWAMMRFADDDELRTIVAHEIAHNAMGHIDAKKKNALLGGLFGAVLDGLAAAADPSAPQTNSNTVAFMDSGANSYSQDFEREADYVGMYILARANIDLERAPDVWRQMGQVNPSAIDYASSHPSHAERFVRLSLAIEEIEAKRAMGVELLPEMRER